VTLFFFWAFLIAFGSISNCPIIPDITTTFNAGKGPIIKTKPGKSKRAPAKPVYPLIKPPRKATIKVRIN
jgi:hypothetical protein